MKRVTALQRNKLEILNYPLRQTQQIDKNLHCRDDKIGYFRCEHLVGMTRLATSQTLGLLRLTERVIHKVYVFYT